MSALSIFCRRAGSDLMIGRPFHYIHRATGKGKRPVSFKLVDKSTPNDPMSNMLQVRLPRGKDTVQMEVQFRNTSSQLAYLNPETYLIKIADGNVIEVNETDSVNIL